MADALNISVGDVAVKDIAPFGSRALIIDVDTTFKAQIPSDAEPEEVHRQLQQTMMHGDESVSRLADNTVLPRTQRATQSHPKVCFLI